MSFFPCCKEVGTGGDTGGTHTIINIGGAVEWYVIGTGPAPFEFRTALSSDASITITQGASTNDFVVDFGGNVSIINVGGFAEWFRVGTVNPFELRTTQSSDGSVSITTNANDLDFTVDVAGAVSLANIGTGLDVFDTTSGPNPFNLRRLEVIDDGSDIHGTGNLAFWTDGDTNKIDLPRGNVQNSNNITPFNVLTTLIDHTFQDDSAGANVAGKDGEDWQCWWSLKICGDPGFGGIDYVSQLQVHDGVGFVVVDQHHVRWTVGVVPSAPGSRPFLLTNTDWSTAGGLRMRIQCATSNFAIGGFFEHPSIHIQRFNKVAPPP